MRPWKNYSVFVMLCLAVTPLSVAAADSSPTARDWLEKMSRATHELDFEGTFVYLHDQQMMAMHITHMIDAQGAHERLLPLSGAGHELILDGNNAASLSTQESASVIDPSGTSFPEALPSRVEQLEANYDFALLGRQRVAGRLTQGINVKPKDNLRFGYRLWLDDASGLLLKADMLNESGVPIERMMFTELSVGNVVSMGSVNAATASGSTPAESGADIKQTEKAAAAQPEPPAKTLPSTAQRPGDDWRITQLPKGFKLVERNKYLMSANQMPVEHLVLTDGLASVSVFIEKSAPEDKFVGISHRGAVNAYGVFSHGHQITLVGEVPVATVQLIGQSIRHQSEP
ncbi:MAG: MucB/RseB C-terminal domain-containing protein [Gammaproteobacteria bacterium]